MKSEKQKIIGVLTATRAEYGLLKPLLQKFLLVASIEVKVLVTGMHLSPEFGMTVHEIEADNIPIATQIPILLSSDTPNAVSKSMGIALISFADYLQNNSLDALIVLGDRYETLAVVIAAFNAQIPIIHLYGGDTTEGALDEAYRHAITKMSYLHFTSTQEYRKRVIQLGESPDRVFSVGGLGIENIKSIEFLSKEELSKDLNFDLTNEFALITFHPVTLENIPSSAQIDELLEAIVHFPHLNFIFTKANSDAQGRIINNRISQFVKNHPQAILVESLGMKRYLSALKYASFVLGNSSSGLTEVPSFGIPTINIGDRQKGRVRAESVIECKPESQAIISAIKFATTGEFKEKVKDVVNPYGDGDTSGKIVKILIEEIFHKKIDLKKKFYDIEFGI